jgi:hypothetical protein
MVGSSAVTAVQDRALPASIETERLVLGSILLNEERYPDVVSVLAVEDFSLEKHRRIYGRMTDLYDRGEHIDRITIAEELSRHGQLESVDGLSYLVSLDVGLPEIVNLAYLRILKNKALLRETMFACQKTIEQCALSSEPSIEILDAAAGVLESIRNRGGPAHCWTTPAQILAGLTRIGFLYPQQIIWNKQRTVLTRTHYWYQHEPCWYLRRKNAPWFGKAGENSTVWDAVSPKFIFSGSDEGKFDHPTQKPVELMRRPILNHLRRGELVYEPFLAK